MTWQEKYQSALAYQQAGRLDAAERGYRATIAANPRFGAAHHNLGAVLHLRGRYRQAIHAFETSARLDPDLAGSAHLGVGAVLMRTGDYARAETELCAAIAATPTAVDPHRFLADLYRTVGRMEEARAALQDGLRYGPEDPEVRFGLAAVRLALGEMPEGWDDYEYRKSKLATPALQPIWNGEEITGRTLLIHSEQGDWAMRSSSCAMCHSWLRAERSCFWPCDRRSWHWRRRSKAWGALSNRLTRFRDSISVARFRACRACSARRSRRFRTMCPIFTPIPRGSPRGARLGETDDLTVAVAWRGSPTHRNDHRRSIPDGEIAPLFKAPNVRFLVLQQDDGDAPDGANVVKLGSHDLNDIAAIMSIADLTISVDTVFCHLAGALGRPVWTMLCVSPDWRWQLTGETTPWYPTMRLFRQDKPSDWNPVVRNVGVALAQVPRRQA